MSLLVDLQPFVCSANPKGATQSELIECPTISGAPNDVADLFCEPAAICLRLKLSEIISWRPNKQREAHLLSLLEVIDDESVRTIWTICVISRMGDANGDRGTLSRVSNED